METELGRIAHLLASATDTTTPLQTRLARVSQTLLVLCLGIVAVTAVLGFVRGRPPLEVFMSAVSLAVAAVPEGLPAIVTIALAIGVQRMAARHVLIRRLPAVETLGSATVICTDKTGTLTTGVMTVRELWGREPPRAARRPPPRAATPSWATADAPAPVIRPRSRCSRPPPSAASTGGRSRRNARGGT